MPTKKAATKKVPRKRARPKPPLVRGEAVVQKVLDAALEELATVGYRAFRMEEVALRAHVNKTTVYRRWPTKADLVRDSLGAMSSAKIFAPDTGSLRSDLLAFAQAFSEHACGSLGKSLMRMLAAEVSDPEVAHIVRALRDRNLAVPRAMLANAVARGELAPDADHIVIVDAVVGTLHHRMFLMSEEASPAYHEALVDLLLRGALLPAARHPASASPPLPPAAASPPGSAAQ